jgi:uncharacterized protein with HEPN domain
LKPVIIFFLIPKSLDFENFLKDKKIIDAVVRNFEIIEQAAVLLSEDFKIIILNRMAKNYRIPYRTIHEYFGIDYENVWKIKEENVHELIEQVEMLIKDLS